jgi:Na+/glutamate symporter
MAENSVVYWVNFGCVLDNIPKFCEVQQWETNLSSTIKSLGHFWESVCISHGCANLRVFMWVLANIFVWVMASLFVWVMASLFLWVMARLFLSKYVALLFNMISINCKPQNIPGLSRLKRKKKLVLKMCG